MEKGVNRVVYSDIILAIDVTLGKEPFTTKQLNEILSENFPDSILPKNLSATVCTMTTRGYFKRLEEKNAEGLTQYALAENKLIEKEPNTRKTYFSAHDIIEIIKENIEPGKPFTRSILKEYISSDMTDTSLGYHIQRLCKRGKIKRLSTKADNLEYRYVLIVKEEEQPTEPATPLGIQSVPALPDNAPADQSNIESLPDNAPIDQPDDSFHSADNEDLTSNETSRIILTEEIMKILDIPFEILGEAMFRKIRDLNRGLIMLEEKNAKLERANSALKGRMAEQYNRIENLNAHITQLNDKLNRPTNGRNNSGLAQLGEIAKFSTLKGNKN
jgi:uncharacterized coiled-coil protein SlyX